MGILGDLGEPTVAMGKCSIEGTSLKVLSSSRKYTTFRCERGVVGLRKGGVLSRHEPTGTAGDSGSTTGSVRPAPGPARRFPKTGFRFGSAAENQFGTTFLSWEADFDLALDPSGLTTNILVAYKCDIVALLSLCATVNGNPDFHKPYSLGFQDVSVQKKVVLHCLSHYLMETDLVLDSEFDLGLGLDLTVLVANIAEEGDLDLVGSLVLQRSNYFPNFAVV